MCRCVPAGTASCARGMARPYQRPEPCRRQAILTGHHPSPTPSLITTPRPPCSPHHQPSLAPLLPPSSNPPRPPPFSCPPSSLMPSTGGHVPPLPPAPLSLPWARCVCFEHVPPPTLSLPWARSACFDSCVLRVCCTGCLIVRYVNMICCLIPATDYRLSYSSMRQYDMLSHTSH